MMKCVSGIAVVNSPGEGSSTGEEIGLCEAQIEVPDPKEHHWLTAEETKHVRVKRLTVSDGSDIMERCQFTMGDLQIFTSSNASEDDNISAEQYEVCLWYELIKHLTGHQIYCADCTDKIRFTRWVCERNNVVGEQKKGDDKGWNFVLELQSQSSGDSTLRRKIVQFKLLPIEKGELDLFELSFELFKKNCQINDDHNTLLIKYHKANEQVSALKNERETMETLIKRRDHKTRLMITTLLNEKKKKIIELQSRINDDYNNDSNLINKHIKESVSELNSPGKRRNRRKSPQSRTSPSKKDQKLQKNVSLKRERSIDDDFDNFQFYGIDKRLKLDREKEKSPNVKVEDADNIKIEDPGDNDIIKKENSRDFNHYIDNGGNIKDIQQNLDVKLENNSDKLVSNKATSSETDLETDLEVEETSESDNTEGGVTKSDYERETETETDPDPDPDK